MALMELNRNPSERELRQFAGMFLVFFGAIGTYLYASKDAQGAGISLIALALLLGIAGLLRPSSIRLVFVGWMIAAFPIGWTISHLLLAAIYYLVVTPIALLLRLGGSDPMNRKFDPEAQSYWVEHQAKQDASRYFRQF